MGMVRIKELLALCLAGLLLAGCASQEVEDSGAEMETMDQASESDMGSEVAEVVAPPGPVVENG